MGFIPLAACIFVGLWAAYQLLIPSHG
jgi:hypothetical protein